ncbi:MAG: hypothetical protein IIA89_08075 [Chloroflexi bacterium]|nr:hypothetical protein [Chloroflexota bacterium]
MDNRFDSIRELYAQSAFNGTVSVSHVWLEWGHALIRVENISMATSINIFEAPSSMLSTRLDPDVIRSLDRSITENATVWEELSKQ